METRFDIIIFGASGFTGEFAIAYVAKLTKAEGRLLSWGVAGRSREKLEDALQKTTKRIGEDLTNTPIIIADVNEEESIKQMTARAKIIVNCAGPFVLYGEAVVKACIETGTHHVDVSGEPLFAEGLELRYGKVAKEKGLYIVSSCGFHSLPMDVGLNFLETHFNGSLNSIDFTIQFYKEEGCKNNLRMRYATWLSILTSLEGLRKTYRQRKRLYPNALPKLKYQHGQRYFIGKDAALGDAWTIPFPTSDCDVVMRSQRYFYEHHHKRPVQAGCYTVVESFVGVLVCFVAFLFFVLPILLLTQFKLGKKLLLKYPAFFCPRLFSHEDNTDEELDLHRFCVTLRAEGWSETLEKSDYLTPPDSVIVGRISGANPGYGMTSLGVILCGIIILTEPEKLPEKGGVYTPAVAFAKTTLLEQLQRNGIKFEILEAFGKGPKLSAGKRLDALCSAKQSSNNNYCLKK